MAIPSRRAERTIGTASELDRCSRCTAAPVCRAASMSSAMARFSTPRGREARKLAYSRPLAAGASLQRVAVLGVHDHHGAEPGELGEVAVELGDRQRRELVHPGRRQEALEPEHALVVQAAQVVDVARDGATPEPDVDVAAPVGGLPLDLQRLDRARGRDAVERHVEQRGDAARRGGPGGRREALPLGAAGLVDVHVGVDEAGQQHLVVGEVDGLGDRVVGLDRGDDAVAHHDGRRRLPRRASGPAGPG